MTVNEAAKILNQAGCTIRKHAKILGLKKFGSRWIIYPEDLSKLQNSIHHRWNI